MDSTAQSLGALFLGVLLVAGSDPAFSQNEQGGMMAAGVHSSTTNYRFADPNELTIVVSLLGAVRNPGRYEISRSIDLLNLVALAGGPTDVGDLSDVRIIRTMNVASGKERREIRLNLEDLKEIFDPYLVLQQGDFIYVGKSSKITFSDVLQYVTTAAVLTTAIVTVINQTRGR